VRETFTARRDHGAWLNNQPIHAADTAATGQAIIEVGWSRRTPTPVYQRLCERLLNDGASLRQGGSGALGLADVAAGRLDGYVELHINLWDVAAALVILREAGARVSDFIGADGGAAGNAIVALAPGLAEAWSDLPGLPAPV
jgi:myo-inositol-1(or 4)-monophosphatase